MSGWQFGDDNPFQNVPCASQLSQEWRRTHRGASQWDFHVDGESVAAAHQRRLRAQRQCGNCSARPACLALRKSLVDQYGFPVSGIWGGKIFGDDAVKPPNPTLLSLIPIEDVAA